MKKTLVALFCITAIYAGNSIYPLKYTFNDEGFTVDKVMQNFEKTYEFSLNDYNDNRLVIHNKILYLDCQNIDSLDMFLNLTNEEKCLIGFEQYTRVKEILMNKFKILIYQNNNSIVEQQALIFYDKKLFGTMTFISSNNEFDMFYKILYSIKVNTNIQKLDYYLQRSRRFFEKMHFNKSLKYALSGQIIDPQNEDIRDVLSRIIQVKKNTLEFNSLYLNSN